MRPAPDDEFKLRFPVAKDRTLAQDRYCSGDSI